MLYRPEWLMRVRFPYRLLWFNSEPFKDQQEVPVKVVKWILGLALVFAGIVIISVALSSHSQAPSGPNEGTPSVSVPSQPFIPLPTLSAPLAQQPPTVFKSGESWTSGESVTYTVTWALKPADPGESPYGPTHPNQPYLEVSVHVINKGVLPVVNIRPNVAANGTFLGIADVGYKSNQADLLNGESGTFKSEWVAVPVGTPLKVILSTFDHSPGVQGQVTIYWTGDAK